MALRTLGGDGGDPVRVLLIEDNPRHAQLLEDMMGTAGVAFAGAAPYELTHADRLSKGLECLARGGIDLVLLDLSLPDAQGLEPIMHVRERNPDVPVVALTGANEGDLAAQALQAGAQDYLTKGRMSGAALARSVRYALRLNRLEEALRSRSLTDGLTGVHNRRGFVALAEPHMKLARRMKGRFLVMSADVTDLGEINRVAGYDEGDHVLRETAEMLKRTFRDSDLVARLEGSAFVVLAADAPMENRGIIAGRIGQQVRAFNAMTLRNYTLGITTGFAQFDPTNLTASISDLMATADHDRSGPVPPPRTSRQSSARVRT